MLVFIIGTYLLLMVAVQRYSRIFDRDDENMMASVFFTVCCMDVWMHRWSSSCVVGPMNLVQGKLPGCSP